MSVASTGTQNLGIGAPSAIAGSTPSSGSTSSANVVQPLATTDVNSMNWHEIMSLLHGLDPASVQHAGQVHTQLGQALDQIATRLTQDAQLLAENWSGSAAQASMNQFQQLYDEATQLSQWSSQVGSTLTWLGTEVLPNFKTLPNPGDGGSAGSDAMMGAGIGGAVGGPIGAAIGGAIGGLIGGLFGMSTAQKNHIARQYMTQLNQQLETANSMLQSPQVSAGTGGPSPVAASPVTRSPIAGVNNGIGTSQAPFGAPTPGAGGGPGAFGSGLGGGSALGGLPTTAGGPSLGGLPTIGGGSALGGLPLAGGSLQGLPITMVPPGAGGTGLPGIGGPGAIGSTGISGGPAVPGIPASGYGALPAVGSVLGNAAASDAAASEAALGDLPGFSGIGGVGGGIGIPEAPGFGASGSGALGASESGAIADGAMPADAALGAQTAAADSSAAGGAAGAAGDGMSGFPMMGSGGAGQAEKDRQRQAWMYEDEDIWGLPSGHVPPVIEGGG